MYKQWYDSAEERIGKSENRLEEATKNVAHIQHIEHLKRHTKKHREQKETGYLLEDNNLSRNILVVC